jgi:hypothetical protein
MQTSFGPGVDLNLIQAWVNSGLGVIESGNTPDSLQDMIANSTPFGPEFIVDDTEMLAAHRAWLEESLEAQRRTQAEHDRQLREHEERVATHFVEYTTHNINNMVRDDLHRVLRSPYAFYSVLPLRVLWELTEAQGTSIRFVYFIEDNMYATGFVERRDHDSYLFSVAICSSSRGLLEIRGTDLYCNGCDKLFNHWARTGCIPIFQDTTTPDNLFNRVPAWYTEYFEPVIRRTVEGAD